MRANLQQVFDTAIFAKYPVASRIVYEVEKLGFEPTVIVSYRSFGSYAISMRRRTGASVQELFANYVDTYQTSLLQLRMYGGCVVDYADMVDAKSDVWIESLARVTGIASNKIIAARSNLVKDVRTSEETPAYWDAMMAMNEQPQQIYEILQSLNGQVIEAK